MSTHSYRRKMQRGFIHVLLLVFAVLGLTMWGASELQHWAEEKQQNIIKTSGENLISAREALFNYALLPPERIEFNNDANQYNAYTMLSGVPDRRIPFRYFALPCPDVAVGGDTNLDGVSDVLQTNCGEDGFESALQAGSRFGRLPWRDEKTETTGNFNYVRGLGNIDFRDGYNQRLWYAVSPNLIDVIDITDPAFDRPLNPHYLLRLTTGWLSAYEESNGDLLSNRVAAAVITPGASGAGNTGARISEERLYAGPGTTPAVVNTQLVGAYLEPADNYADFFTAGGSGLSLTVRGDVDTASADRTEYLTIEELAADGSEGIAVLENSAQNIYNTIDGDGEFLNIVDLMSQHLERYGFLPDPAIYDAGIATQYSRPDGPAAQTTVTASYTYTAMVGSPPMPTQTTEMRELPFQQGLRMSASAVQSLEVRIADLPPVYLADGTILTLAPRRGELFPPYGSALARLESDLNAVPLSATPAGKVALDMVLRGPEGNRMSTHYPEEGLGGLQSTALISIHFSPPDLVPPISVVQAVNTILTPVPPFTVILADGAYGYFLGDTLISIVAYPNGKSPADIAALPPHAAKAYIPPGTRITIGTSNDVSVQIPHLPALPPGSAFDPDTGAWTIGPGLEIPVRLMAGNDQYLTIAAMPNNFPVVVGDSGFLPTEEAVVVDDMEGITISLSDQTNAISRLALPTRFHVDMSLLLQPFPPPGRPLAGGYEAQADAQPLATPYHLQPGTQFTVPAGSRIIYQPGVTFTTGDSFSFPANSILQIAPGAVVEVELLSASVLPGGISLTNTAGEVMLITLFHGGFVNIEDARMNFSDSNFLSSAQELFDIELRADALMLLAAPPHTALSGNEVIRPFINRRYTPQAAITLANAVFSSDSYVRAEFITRPRYLRLPGDDGAGDPSGMATDKAVASSYNQPREITLSDLRGLQGLGATVELEHNGLTDITVSITFDEDSEFFIPPNTPITLALSAFVQSLHIDGSRTTDNMRSVVLPAGTGFYDRDTNPPLSELTLALPPASPPTPMYPNLVVMNSPLTLTLAELAGADIIARGAGPRSEGLLENRLLLYPESDMYVHTDAGGGVTVVSLVAAGSVVDLLEGVIYAPVGMQRIKRVAEDLSIRSSDIAYIYNSKAVTLSIGKPTIRFEDTGTTVQVAPPPPSPITVLQAYYHSFSDYVDTPGSDINSEALTLVSDIVLPANSYIQLPPGQDIDFLSNNVGSTGSNPLDIPLADYAHLPPGAVAVIPHGASATATYQEIDNTSSPPMTMALATIIHGPAYLNLNDGRGGAAAFINSPAYLQTSPLVFLTGEARLFDLSSAPLVTDGVYSQPAAVTNRIYSYIPPNVRLDLHGNMERRIDSGFHTDLLPASSRQFYQDFPLIYAVAPECRRSARLHGSDCAQGEGEGLEFDLEAGEEYILRAPMEIPAAALITSAYPNIPLNVQVMDIGSDVVRETNSGILAILIDSTGMVTFTGGTYTPQLNDKIVVSIDALNHHTELRTYMSVGLALNSVLDDVSYVAVDDQALTIYSGGYVGDNYRNAAGVSTIQMNEPLAYGYGADLNLVTPGDKVFGAESMATVMFPRGGGVSYNTEINLADYTYAGPGTSIPSEAFIVSVTLSADTYDLDNNNYLYFSANAGSVLMAQGNSLDIDGVISLNSPTEIITVTAGTAIPMRSGYLWQGYMPRDADWALGQNVTMVSVYKRELYDHGVATNDPATITLASLMDNRLHLRIQSTVAELNLWGSGLERPESLDAESFTFEQQPIMPIIDGGPGVGRTGSGTPYYSYGAGRHIRHQERSRIYEDGYLEGLVAPDRPDTSRPGTPGTPGTPGMAGVVTIDLTAGEAVGSFAELMDSTKVTMIAFGMDDREIFADVRNVDHLSIRVRVRNITVDAAGVTVTVLTTVNAHWRPVVVVDGTPNDVTIPGHVRVNFGSNSPLEGSDSMQSFWVNYYEGGTPHKEAQLLPHEWIGRHNQAAEPENGYIDNFMCGTTGATAVFNIPHTDLIGNNPQYRVWPSAERNYAHINNFQNQGVLIVANGADYNVLTPATRDPYAPVLRLTTIAGNVTTEVSGPITIITEPASTITINTYNADSPIAVANTITTYKDVGPASTDAITLTTRTDWVFYMDRAYHSTADEVYNSPLPQQSLQFGDDFRISGPAAIVPPFAGNNDTATREIYAERSALMNKLFDTPPLHTIYDALTERCRSGTTDDCQALYKNPYWFPIVGGVVTFDGLEITPSTTNADLPGAGDVRVVFPEPETTVVVGGDTVTIYAGSIIYPLRNEIHKANRLPTVGGYELVSDGEVIAYVDTSPAQRRLNYEVRHRAPQAFDSGIFNFAPTHAEGNEDCIVEPIGFVNPGPYLDLDLRAVARAITASVPAVVVDPRYTFDSDDDEDSALCAASPGANFLANTLAMGCYEKPVVGMTFAGEDAIYDTQNPYYFEYGVRDFRNNFEEFAWGGNFTNNTLAWLVDGADTHTNPIDAGFAGRNYTNEPIRYDGSFNRGHIADNDGLALLTNYYRGNEIFAVGLGYGLYGENSDGTTFMPAARAVQVPPLPLLSHNTDGRLKNPSAFQWIHQAQHFQPLGIDNVNTMTSTVLLNFSYATVGVSIETSGDEFDSLRLAHHINIPADTPITLNDYNPDPYPNTEDNFFTFPLRSTAIVINNDLATWESANPYIGLYRIGLEVDLLNTGFRRTIADNSDNEAFSRVDVSGKHVVHYQRSESSQSREPFSAVPIHTNVWLRLPEGGRLQSSNGGETIFLPPNSIVNPIYGTYLQHTPSVREAGFASTSVPNNYMTSAQAVVDLPIVRPALTLPAGGRLLVGMGGATIQNVQAAAFFSLTPLESVQCPTGTANAHDGQIGNPIDATRITVINQIREGVFASDDNYADAVTGRVFSFGHPCAWLDDPENMDGDRFFIYRGRRRYANDNVQVRPTSNDRTYLLGGRLEIGV